MIARIAGLVSRLLMHAYAIVALRIAYVYATDEMEYRLATFQMASAQARALISLAARLSGT